MAWCYPRALGLQQWLIRVSFLKSLSLALAMSSPSRIPRLKKPYRKPATVQAVLAQHTRMLEEITLLMSRMLTTMPAIVEASKMSQRAVEEPLSPAPLVLQPGFCTAQTKDRRRCDTPLPRNHAYLSIGNQRWPVCGTHASRAPRAVYNADGTTTVVPLALPSTSKVMSQ